jgi:hypothetical protein
MILQAEICLLQRMIRWELHLTVLLRKVTPQERRQVEVKKLQIRLEKWHKMMVLQRKRKTINLVV